jgi:hypothetical protein
VKPTYLIIPCLMLALLSGCAEHKEYYYRDFPIPREQAFDGMVNILHGEGYDIVKLKENSVKNLPETYLETAWNMRQAGNPYPGNDVRRRAYVKITTIYSEREIEEHQPLDLDDANRLARLNEEQRMKAELEHTRISIAVRGERRSNIRSPLESDWIYEGPDNLEVMALLGRAQALFADHTGRASRPSARSERLHEERLRHERQTR